MDTVNDSTNFIKNVSCTDKDAFPLELSMVSVLVCELETKHTNSMHFMAAVIQIFII